MARLSQIRTAAMMVCLVLTSIGARAQENRRNEIGFLLGATVTPSVGIPGPNSGRIEVGRGLTFQATYARALSTGDSAALSLEVPFLAIPNQGIETGVGSVPTSYALLFITPGLRLKLFPKKTVSPWFSAGGGYARFDESAKLTNGAANEARGTNRGAAQFGGGVDIRTPLKILFPISIRIEARDFYSGKPNYQVNTSGGFQHNIAFSGGFVVHF